MLPALYVENPAPAYTSSISKLPFTQLFEHIPLLSPFYLDMEKNFQAKNYIEFARATWPALPLAFCSVYVLMITLVPRIMKNREAFVLKRPLALWNLTLSLFSFCGMVRTVPHLLHMIANKPFRDTICGHPESAYCEGASGLWVMLFIFSKLPELVDTAFIVFRKSVSSSRNIHYMVSRPFLLLKTIIAIG